MMTLELVQKNPKHKIHIKKNGLSTFCGVGHNSKNPNHKFWIGKQEEVTCSTCYNIWWNRQ